MKLNHLDQEKSSADRQTVEGRRPTGVGRTRDKSISVAIIMGSQSDWQTMMAAARELRALDITYEARVLSAHRTPHRLAEYAGEAERRGFSCIIAGAGGAAHLPGMMAAFTTLPVLGVPVASRHLQGMDSLLSIVQMPRGVPVATFAVGEAGAANAALFAAAMLATTDAALARRLKAFRERQAAEVMAATLPGLA